MKLGTDRIRKATRRSVSIVIAVLSVIALVALMATPALAHHKDGHDNGPGSSNDRIEETSTTSDHDGDADSDASDTQTEDDTDPRENTPEDVADAGDNKHPSGKDRSVESGNSTSNPNQGKSESNPDDSKGPMRYEGGLGDDKPNGPGGTDAADQDGNNGCGNDDDFDDDNNGHCGRNKPAPRVDEVLPQKLCPAGTDKAGQPMENPSDCVKDEVIGRTDKVCPAGTDFAGQKMETLADCKKDVVLGSVINRSVPKVQGAPLVQAAAPEGVLGAVLPFTGGNVTIFLALGLALIGLGALALMKLRSN